MSPPTDLDRRTLTTALAALATAPAVALAPRAFAQSSAPDDLAGTWTGELAHAGKTTRLWLQIEPNDKGQLAARLHVPVIHVYDVPLGPVTLEGERLKMQLLSFAVDRGAGTLHSDLPPEVVPVHKMSVTLRRVPRFDKSARPPIEAPVVQPRWVADTGAPAWADVAAARGVVYAANDAGRVLALDAVRGDTRWSYAAGNAIRARPTIAGDTVYVAADDGHVTAIDARTGAQSWKVRVDDKPIERLLPADPKSRHNHRGGAVTVGQRALFVGTHGGRVLALHPRDGATRWSFAAGDSIVAAPELGAGRVFAGSYDGRVYALDPDSGRRAWSFDTRQPVTSTPVFVAKRTRGVVLVGSRSYELWGLDAANGEVLWNRYLWFSWIESTPAVRDGIAYVGSSDGAVVLALDALTGRSLWETDVFGLAWGTPALLGSRVYIGTRGAAPRHSAHVLALDAARGGVAWRYPMAPAEGADRRAHWGFAGSGAADEGLVFFPALDGRIYAFGA